MIGTILDEKYRIERLLGRGGMGAVYAGVDVRTGDTVAIKIIQTQIPARVTDIVARFEREARTAGSLDTEHIVKCFGAGTERATGQPYMVLEYLAGEDLQRVLRRTGPLAPDVALRITTQACLGLMRAHQANVIHRDIKPANLFLARRGGEAKDAEPDAERVVKILDFGIAKILRSPAEEQAAADGLTRTGSLLGSPMYMSPEQARSVKKVDQRADIWSLGVVLYKMLAARTPFDHVSALGDMILALWSEPAPPVQQFSPWVSPEIAAIVDRMLQIEPTDRFQSATEVLDAITPLLLGGTTIRESMLVSLPRDAREHGAPMFFRRIDSRRIESRSRPPVRRSDPDQRALAATLPSDVVHEVDESESEAASESASRTAPAAGSPGAAGQPAPDAPGGTIRIERAVTRSSAPPGVVTQTDLSTSGASPPHDRKRRGVKVVGLGAAALAIGLALAFFFARGGDTRSPAVAPSPAALGPAVQPALSLQPVPNMAPAPIPTAAPAPIPTAAPTAEPTSLPTASATSGASARPSPPTPARGSGLSKTPGPVRPARPAAPPQGSAPSTATAAPPPPATSFTDFGDRK